jgi:dihydroflavonol-4-reductase
MNNAANKVPFSPVLVTGASGQLGRRLVPRLLVAGYQVKAHYRSLEKAAKRCPSGCEAVIGDLLKPEWLYDAAKGCQAVIHGAARVSMRQGNYDEQYKINVEGTKAVIAACKSAGVKRLIYISSIVSVGASSDSNLVDETLIFNLGGFDIPYIQTKRKAEELALAANGPSLEVISVNPSIMISAPDREVTPNDLRKIPKFLPAYFDFGLNLVETGDVVNGIVVALERGRPGERYLLTGDNIDPQKLFALGKKYFGIKKPILKIPVSALVPISLISELVAKIQHKRPKLYRDMARLGRFRFIYSHQKASRELGYNPKPLEETLANIINKIKPM